MLKLAILLLIVLRPESYGLRRQDDICSHQNARRLYLEFGESRLLTAQNVTFNASSHERCFVQIVTCSSCVIEVVFQHINLTTHCTNGGNLISSSPCRCDYVWISEPPYEEVSGVPFCGVSQAEPQSEVEGTLKYKSQTRTLSIVFAFRDFHKHAFTLEYTSQRNRQLFVGSPSVFSKFNLSSSGFIISPFFPMNYPRDLVSEYTITCLEGSYTQGVTTPTTNGHCRIRLIFSDFQVAPVSVMEFYDGNRRRLNVTSGTSFRPPVILSSGPSLTIRFFANGGADLGFKALYTFISESQGDKAMKPVTDCGGFVENFGGAITMMNMVDLGIKTYDCVWLIRPPKNFLRLKTHLYLKVITFTGFAGSAVLQIRQGMTSELPVLETLRYPSSQMGAQDSTEHIIVVSSGFYVSLRGSFGPSTRLAIAYASFSYDKCFAGSEFLCHNHRCIPGKLSCDGFDHCGDNSDEPVSCYHDWEMQPVDRRWDSHTPNYYFPKMDRYPDLKAATLLFVICSLGLILLISTLIILLYKMGSRARQQRDLQNRLQTISELLDDPRIEEMVTADDPPGYDPPPDYDDVMKPSSSSARRKKSYKSRSRRSRSSPGERRSQRREAVEINKTAASVSLFPRPLLNNPQQSIPPRCEDASSNSPPPPYSAESEMFTWCERNRASLAGENDNDIHGAKNFLFTDLMETNTVRSRTFSASSDETRLPDSQMDSGSLRRCQSYSDDLSSITSHNKAQANWTPLDDLTNFQGTQKQISIPVRSNNHECIVQLDVAIENQLQSLLASCSHTITSSSASSASNTDAETFYFSSPESNDKPRKFELKLPKFDSLVKENPFQRFQAFFNSEETSLEVGSAKGELDDRYWEEFDKQFQNPVRKINETFHKGKKVADLSKKYNNFLNSVDDKTGVKEKFLMEYWNQKKSEENSSEKESVGLCDCKGACSCATSFKSKHFQPIRKRKRGALPKSGNNEPAKSSIASALRPF